jgi:DNA-binding CsgD family transcriptional regulator
MVKFGKTPKEIAGILNLSEKTVEFYRKSIRRKIGITNQSINLRTFLSSSK